jgi:phosphatidylserine/phosphatidylglycerophosphate/cardiolipin synthase-like enzyme
VFAVRPRRALALAALTLGPLAPASRAQATYPRPVPRHDNQVELVFTLPGYVDRLLGDIAEAERSVYLDHYLLGGKVGTRVARALAARARAGLDVRVLLDGWLGTAGKFRREARKVRKVLDREGVPWRPAVTREGSGIRRRVVDHNKLAVVDRRIAYVGGTNVSDIWLDYNDLMLRVEGPVVADVVTQFVHDWDLAGSPEAGLPTTDRLLVAEGLLESRSAPGLSTVRLVGTGPGRRTFEGALLNNLRSAERSIEVQVHQLHHEQALHELVLAHRRGVAVRVLLDPTDIDEQVPLVGGPRGIFNAFAVKTLKEAGVPVRFVRLGEEFDAFHMKLGIFDGQVLLAGSPNWDRRGAEVLTETALEVSGGDAVVAIRHWFDTNWDGRSEDPEVGNTAELINWFLRKFL